MVRNNSCCPRMDLLHSEEMNLVHPIILVEFAHDNIMYLKQLGLLQFKDCVKVYRLNDEGKWDDRGISHVTVDYLEGSKKWRLTLLFIQASGINLILHLESGTVEDASKVQTLIFNTTMPDWVKKIASRILKPDKKNANLVGDDKMEASRSVRHIVLPCFYSARAQVIPDG